MTKNSVIFYSVMSILIGILCLVTALFINQNPAIAKFLLIIILFIFFIILAFTFVSIGGYLIFYWVWTGISITVSKLCIYHKLKTNENNKGETMWEKITLVFSYNFLLTLPMLFTILYIINPSTMKVNEELGLTGLDIGIIVAFSTISALLLTLRLIGNPTLNGITWLKGTFIIKRKFFGSMPDIRKTKDEISSFFSTLIFGTILFLGLLYCSDYLSSGSYVKFLERYYPSFDPLIFSWYIIAYFATLFIVTILGEIILETCVPLDQE